MKNTVTFITILLLLGLKTELNAQRLICVHAIAYGKNGSHEVAHGYAYSVVDERLRSAEIARLEQRLRTQYRHNLTRVHTGYSSWGSDFSARAIAVVTCQPDFISITRPIGEIAIHYGSTEYEAMERAKRTWEKTPWTRFTKQRELKTIIPIQITSDPSAMDLLSGRLMTRFTVKTNFDANFYSAEGLPEGIKLHSNTGVLSGSPVKKGTYSVTFTATRSERNKVIHSATATKVFRVR
jgi:hypothetical protein